VLLVKQRQWKCLTAGILFEENHKGKKELFSSKARRVDLQLGGESDCRGEKKNRKT